MRRLLVLLATLLASIGLQTSVAYADGCPDDYLTCGASSQNGTYDGVIGFPDLRHGGGSGAGGSGGGSSCQGCEWMLVPACSVNSPENGADALCGAAVNSCGGDGILMWVFVRRPKETWDQIGTTCVGPDRPVVTLAQVRADAARLYRDQVKPNAATISPQPANGPWVVNLASYFMATGAEPLSATFGPAGTRMTIDATPTYVWDWGDGSEPYETTSTGGPHPTGDVTHVYRHHGARTVTLTTRWSATFTVVTALGTFGPFDVPGAPIAPTTTTRIRVQEARAETVSGH